MANIFNGNFIRITQIRSLTTLAAAPEGVKIANPGWAPTGLPELPVQLVEFEINTPDRKILQPQVGSAAKEFSDWVSKAAKNGTLDTTRGVLFSGVILSHFGFTLGEATHYFPFAGAYEPRTGGGWVAHSHGAPVSKGDPIFLDLSK